MWERTLQDLIRGLRSNKKDEAKFIAQAVDEIRREVRSKDMELKAAAILKLTYLDMMGYDMTWASFPVVEVMSSPRVHLKTVGYLAATQSFSPDTDVLMLTTNLLKKDLTSATPADVAVALNGMSHVVTADLARDLSRDLISQLNHSRAHIRKRAVVALYKVFTEYPEAISAGMPRFRDKLEDPDPGVVAATVNVLCELARRSPQDYLSLAPQLFHLLTTSTNNWMLIKIIKLFGAMCPHEARLVKKLLPPISELIVTTSAISLLYECVHTCIIGGMLQGAGGSGLATTCVTKLAAFLQDPDHNLKYIALLAITKIVPSYPHLVAEHQDVIMSSVNDPDMSIRMRALDLVSVMVNPHNLQSIVQQLLSHLAQPETAALPSAADALRQTMDPSSSASSPTQSSAYRLLLSQRILAICSASTYENVTDFEWLLSVLVDLVYVAHADVGAQVRDIMVDVVGRVRAARRYAVSLTIKLLGDSSLLASVGEPGSCVEVLWAAAWIAGEFCSELADPQKLLPYFLHAEVARLDPGTIAVYLLSTAKVFAYWAAEAAERWDDDLLLQVKDTVDSTIEGLQSFVSSRHSEVQERAANLLQLFTFIQADLRTHKPSSRSAPGALASGFEDNPESKDEPTFPKSLFLLQPLFTAYELNPVAEHAQASVPVPDGLSLDVWIVPPPPSAEPQQVEDDTPAERKAKKTKKGKDKDLNGVKGKEGKKKKRYDGMEDALTVPDETSEEQAERERLKSERLERMRSDPYYIGLDGDQSTKPALNGHDVDSIPVVRLDDMPLTLRNEGGDSRLPALREPLARVPSSPFVVDKVGEMPAAATSPASRSAEPSPPPALAPRTSPYVSSPYPEYVVDDANDTRASTPEPIKVTRAKKKGGASGKSKRAKPTQEARELPA